MASIDSIRSKLHDLLIEKDGDVKPWDMETINIDAKDLGLSQKQVNKLLIEADSSINWDALRKQKIENLKTVEELKRFAHEQAEKEQNAEETLEFIIQQCAKDKVISANEIAVFFDVSDELNQNEGNSANLLKNYIDKNNFIPFTTPRGTTIRLLLQSTDWYRDKSPHLPASFPWKQTVLGISFILIAGIVLFYLINFKLIKSPDSQTSTIIKPTNALIPLNNALSSSSTVETKSSSMSENAPISLRNQGSLTIIEGRFPDASTSLLEISDLTGLSKQDLKIMRNEIFARHGYIFKTPEMKSYFASQSWYQPKYNNVSSMLTKVELLNVALIKKYE